MGSDMPMDCGYDGIERRTTSSVIIRLLGRFMNRLGKTIGNHILDALIKGGGKLMTDEVGFFLFFLRIFIISCSKYSTIGWSLKTKAMMEYLSIGVPPAPHVGSKILRSFALQSSFMMIDLFRLLLPYICTVQYHGMTHV